MLSPMKSLWTLVRLDAMFEIFELEVCIITKLSAMWSNSCSPTLSSVHLYYRLVFTPSFTPVSGSRRLVLTISQSLGLFKWAWNCFVVFWNWRSIFSYSAICLPSAPGYYVSVKWALQVSLKENGSVLVCWAC